MLTQEKLFTRRQAAKLLNVCPRTIMRHEAVGTLRSVRIGNRVLIPASAIERALKPSPSHAA